MPSRKKSSMFGCAFCSCVSSFVVICVALATPQWVGSRVRFSRTGSNVTVSLSYGLFSGTCQQFVDAGIQVSKSTFQGWLQPRDCALPVSEAPPTAQSQGLGVVTRSILIAINEMNSLCYQGRVPGLCMTFLGPVGVYTWNSVCGVLILIAMILFPVNVEGNSLSEELAHGCATSLQTHIGSKHTYGYSYWIMLLIIILNAASLIIIYFYEHARYSKKKEQERPIENAPKDVILF
ncbi:CLRN3 protein, partial [Aegithalos caudatus]|nr:CLRN3 protein [Aegithalos caudatus]